MWLDFEIWERPEIIIILLKCDYITFERLEIITILLKYGKC